MVSVACYVWESDGNRQQAEAVAQLEVEEAERAEEAEQAEPYEEANALGADAMAAVASGLSHKGFLHILHRSDVADQSQELHPDMYK